MLIAYYNLNFIKLKKEDNNITINTDESQEDFLHQFCILNCHNSTLQINKQIVHNTADQ